MQDYLYYLNWQIDYEARRQRARVIDLIRRYPGQVNDTLYGRDGSWLTPLAIALRAQDAELVRLLLDVGALPVSPRAQEPLTSLTPLPGVARDPEVDEMLHDALRRISPLEICLQARALRLGGNRKGNLARRLTYRADGGTDIDPNETRFLAEPDFGYELHRVFGGLADPDMVLLEVQPLRATYRPAKPGQLYSALRTTARLVRVVKGEPLPLAQVSWSIGIETDYARRTGGPDELREYAADEPSAFLFVPKAQLAEAQAEGDTLNLGGIEPYYTLRGKDAAEQVARVLAIYPELADATPVPEADLVAARELIDKTPSLVRGDLRSLEARLDEAVGQVQVRYRGLLRDPLKGAGIKGPLPPERGIQYERSYPLTDEWRARFAGQSDPSRPLREFFEPQGLPVILALDPEDSFRLLDAYDARDKAAMLRAINALSFRYPSQLPEAAREQEKTTTEK